MRLFHQPPAQSLDEWLAIATSKLVPSAQTRVCAEIESHFQESMETHRADGSREPVALAAALANLGPAKAAARRFQREHLTRNDALIITEIIKRSSRGYIIAGIAFILLILLLPPGGKRALIGFLFLYALEIPGLYFGRKAEAQVNLAGIDPPTAQVRQILHVHFIITLILGVTCFGLSWTYYRAQPELFSTLLVFLVPFLYSGYKLLRLRQKLALLDKNYPSTFPDRSMAS